MQVHSVNINTFNNIAFANDKEKMEHGWEIIR
jgi:hypothetical protein